MNKIFVVDTNVLIDDPTSVDKLSEFETNEVIIPYSVILELDRLKSNINKAHLVSAVISKITESPFVQIFKRPSFRYSSDKCSDDTIIDDVSVLISERGKKEDIVFVTNDKILQLRIKVELGVESQEYKNSKPFLSDSEIYTGLVPEGEMMIRNCFQWREGKLYWERENKLIDYENEVWKIRPRTAYQNMLMELMLEKDIHVVSVQSSPGYGKVLPY